MNFGSTCQQQNTIWDNKNNTTLFYYSSYFKPHKLHVYRWNKTALQINLQASLLVTHLTCRDLVPVGFYSKVDVYGHKIKAMCVMLMYIVFHYFDNLWQTMIDACTMKLCYSSCNIVCYYMTDWFRVLWLVNSRSVSSCMDL